MRTLRGWARLIDGRPGADEDARAYLGLRRGDDPYAAYMAILATLSTRRDGQSRHASDLLDQALANAPPTTWPAPVLRYLKHTINAQELLAAAPGDDQAAEAHAFLGLDLLFSGFSSDALIHLRWVCDHAHRQTLANDLARATLLRLEPADNLPVPLP